MNKIRDDFHIEVDKKKCLWCQQDLFAIGTDDEMFKNLSDEQIKFFIMGMHVTRDCILATLHSVFPAELDSDDDVTMSLD